MTQTILFKEWLPDLPEFNNPGLLEATNAIPSSDGYTPFLPLSGFNTASGAVIGALAVNGVTKGASNIAFAVGGERYYLGNDTGPGNTTLGPLTAGAQAQFAQYENILFAAAGSAHKLARYTMASASTIGAITAAPFADVVGVVGQFVIAGSIYEDEGSGTVTARKSNFIQWSAIDDPVNWPTPGSATAIASQSGEQALYEKYGPIHGIHGGDQYGVILQRAAVTRMTYIGGTAVFQFDVIDHENGSYYRGGSMQVGPFTYYVSAAGFCRTDGARVERIGLGRVDDHWWANDNGVATVAYDPIDGTVHFGNGSEVYIFNPHTNWWTVCQQAHKFLITPAPNLGVRQHVLGYDTSNVLGQFSGTAGSAVFTTGDVEVAPGKFSRVSGVKPLVSGATAVSMTVAIGTRNGQDTAPSYTAETTATSRTGFSDFRSEGRYHRARVTITGNFTKAIGLEVDAVESGAV